MFGTANRPVGGRRRLAELRTGERLPWSRSRRRAAAYAATVEYSMSLMSARMW